MRILSSAVHHAVSRWRRARRRIRNFGYNVVGKNPYPDGSIGSLEWKLQKGEPLNEEERRARDEMEELSRPLKEYLEQTRRFQFQISYVSVAMQLMHNLPKHLRDDLGATPVRDVREKIDALLPLASYQREQTAIKLASYAVFISALAFLISAATLGVAIWTSINVGSPP